MLRGSSESMSVPLNSRESLVTPCHWYRTIKYNDASRSYGEISALCTSGPSLQPSKFPSQRGKEEKRRFQEGTRCPVRTASGEKEGSEQTPRLTSGRPRVPVCVLRLSHTDTEIPGSCRKGESNFRSSKPVDPGGPPWPPGRGSPLLTARATGAAPPRPKQR